MKTLKFFVVALLAVLIASCSGSKSGDDNSVTLKVETELGELSNYLSVTDSEVTVSLSEEEHKGEKGKVLAGSLALNVTKAVASDYSFSFDVEVLDKNHVKIANLPDFKLDSKYDYDNGDLNNVLNVGNIRAQMKTGKKDSEWSDEDQEMWDKIRTEGTYITIKPNSNAKYAEYKSEENIETNEDSPSDVNEEVADDDNNWDELLDSYEEYVNEYASLIKKAQNGDMDAASEYAEYLQKAQELGEKFSKAQGTMTAEQWARYNKLLKKLGKSIQ